MTNKKFKLAAMSLALTACVAASPLAANAESAGTEVNNSVPTTATSGENTPATNENNQESANEAKQDTTNENDQKATDNNEQNAADKNEQNAANNNEQDAANNNEQNAANNNEQNAANNNEQNAANNNEQNAANNNEQGAANNNEQDAANNNEQDAANNNEQDAADNNEQNAADNNEQDATNNNEQDAADNNEQDAANNNEQDAANKNEQDAANNNEQNAANNNEQDAANNNEQNAADNNEQNAADNNEQNAADNNEQNAANNNEQDAANVNGVPAAAKAPVLMLAKAPDAPTGASTAPAEENTADEVVATLNGKDYKSFDEAVNAAQSGDTIEVIKDATSTGIDLQNKNLTIKGKTVTTTTDSGTEEKTTVKPKLKFVAKDGQPQIFGITLRGSDLTFQNMDVDMTGASSTTYNNWNAVCMSGDAALTLKSTDLFMNGKGLDERKDQKILKPHGIYMAGRGRNELNVDDHSTLTINNYYNAIAWDGVGNEDSIYYINIKNGSTFTADGNEAGIVGLESLDVLVEDSTMTITNCRARYPDKTDDRVTSGEHEGRSGLNGADVTITRSNVTISGCEQGYGIHTRDLHVENSTLTTDNNGYSSIFITGKGEFINSTINARGNTGLGNDTIEITRYTNETGIGYHYGSLKVTNSTLNITNNNATGIRCNFGDLNIDDASRVTVQYNKATDNNGYNSLLYGLGGGLVVRRGTTAKLGANTTINNNSAALAGADIFIEKGGKLTFSVGNAGIGDILNKGQEDADCGHKIDGWYIDANGSRWNFDADADAAQAFLDSLDELPEGVTVNYDPSTGLYTITVAKTVKDGFALKAAHAELPAPTPDPDGPDTPTPNPDPKPEPKPGPDTSITPEDPQLHPVQDARADTPDSPVLPANRTNPAVQDAHALPQTGTSLFAALAMALSGFALTIAGAWASLLGKNSRH